MEQKRHLIRTLELYREHGDGDKVPTKLLNLAGVKGMLGFRKGPGDTTSERSVEDSRRVL